VSPKDGHRVPVSVAFSPIRDSGGKLVGTSRIARDISDRKALRKRCATQETRRSRCTGPRPENANHAKTDFLAAMSHEIRTPLTCIEGVVYLLTRSQALTPEQLRHVELVKNASIALRINRRRHPGLFKGRSRPVGVGAASVDLSALIQDTVAIIAPLASAKNLELTYSIDAGTPKTVSGDQRRLSQVLLNLLANAGEIHDGGLCEAPLWGRRGLRTVANWWSSA